MRKDTPVRIKNAKPPNHSYNGELGLVKEEKKDGRAKYYVVKLNTGHEISVSKTEIEVLKNR